MKAFVTMTQNTEAINAKTHKRNDKLGIRICHSYHKGLISSLSVELLWKEEENTIISVDK